MVYHYCSGADDPLLVWGTVSPDYFDASYHLLVWCSSLSARFIIRLLGKLLSDGRFGYSFIASGFVTHSLQRVVCLFSRWMLGYMRRSNPDLENLRTKFEI